MHAKNKSRSGIPSLNIRLEDTNGADGPKMKKEYCREAHTLISKHRPLMPCVLFFFCQKRVARNFSAIAQIFPSPPARLHLRWTPQAKQN